MRIIKNVLKASNIQVNDIKKTGAHFSCKSANKKLNLTSIAKDLETVKVAQY